MFSSNFLTASAFLMKTIVVINIERKLQHILEMRMKTEQLPVRSDDNAELRVIHHVNTIQMAALLQPWCLHFKNNSLCPPHHDLLSQESIEY